MGGGSTKDTVFSLMTGSSTGGSAQERYNRLGDTILELLMDMQAVLLPLSCVAQVCSGPGTQT
jgi:hypothetical protein